MYLSIVGTSGLHDVRTSSYLTASPPARRVIDGSLRHPYADVGRGP